MTTTTTATSCFENGAFAAQWSLTDFYDEQEAQLRAAIESGKPYDTERYGCKKEIRWGRIWFDGKATHVEAEAESDELEDLMDTVVWDACGGNDFAGSGYDALVKLLGSEEAAEDRLNDLIDQFRESYESTCTDEETAQGHLDYDAVVELMDKVEARAASGGQSQFTGMVETIKDLLQLDKASAGGH